jgi:peptidoglycan LD-endopeptidase LytH
MRRAVVRAVCRAVVAALLVAGAVLAWPFVQPAIQRAWFVYKLSQEPPPAHLPIPIKSARPPRLIESWGAARSGGRHHEGIDIFAPKDSPVLSTTRGVVVQVGTNTLGGRIVKVLGPGLEWHYYAHLDRYGDVHTGDIVAPGAVIGYVGNTGNARGTPYHLHYGIYNREGVAEDPYPRLAASRIVSRSVPRV